jgi:rhodanese-related sulfurtransferase
MMALKRIGSFLLLSIILIASDTGAAHKGIYAVKRPHGGMNVKPKGALELIQKNPDHSFIVDVRTRYEYQDIGHAEGSHNIPFLFYSTEVGKKGYKKIMNMNFCSDLKARFNPDTDSLYMMCRSGERSTLAVDKAIACGYGVDKVYNILGGFEGDKVHEPDSPFYGQRMVGGWRHEGLPWTYKMNHELMYLPDINK